MIRLLKRPGYRLPEGSTARFVKDGTLPGDVQQSATVDRIAS